MQTTSYRLSLLGWSQEEIGLLNELDQTRVSKIMTELNKFKLGILSDFFEKKKKVSGLDHKNNPRTQYK